MKHCQASTLQVGSLSTIKSRISILLHIACLNRERLLIKIHIRGSRWCPTYIGNRLMPCSSFTIQLIMKVCACVCACTCVSPWVMPHINTYTCIENYLQFPRHIQGKELIAKQAMDTLQERSFAATDLILRNAIHVYHRWISCGCTGMPLNTVLHARGGVWQYTNTSCSAQSDDRQFAQPDCTIWRFLLLHAT